MKLNGARKVFQVSENLFQIERDFVPEDILKVIRVLTQEKKYPACEHFGDFSMLYTTTELTKEEFVHLFKKQESVYARRISDILDTYFQRDILAEKAKRVTKVISSTTKTELVSFLSDRSDVLYEDKDLRDQIIHNRAMDMKNFTEGRLLIPSPVGEYKISLHVYDSSAKPISGKLLHQFWVLRWSHSNKVKIVDHQSRAYGDVLFLNTKDPDERLLELIKSIPEPNGSEELDLEVYEEEIKPDKLNFSTPEEIVYSSDINKLAEHFGKRCGSKFETFAAGLEQRTDQEQAKRLCGKRFLVAAKSSTSLYFGSHVDKELFEKIALHLSIEYVESGDIICTAGEKKTRETISAIWEFAKETTGWGRQDGSKRFYVIQLN